jgi:hypothetical protein
MAPRKKAEPKKETIPKSEKPKAEYTPFDFINAISYDKRDLIRMSENPEGAEKLYNPFLTNRGLSYHMSSIMEANILNQLHYLDKQLQFDCALNMVRKEKRFSKWFKPESNEVIELICKHYQCNIRRAQEYASILTPEQLEKIREQQFTGGMKR